jgi:excinuclease ABC subunit C
MSPFPLNQLPLSAGIYLFKNLAGCVLYVGKARNLRARISSYFSEKGQTLKTQTLVAQIADVEVILVPLEIDALLLEREFIKQHKPLYNILLRDDKEYPLVRVNLTDPWPRFRLVRRVKKDGAQYLGPFASALQLRNTLQLMYKIFPLVRCTEREFANVTRPCNYYAMKKCLAPCHLPVDRTVYMEMVHHAMEFLQGKNQKVQLDLKAKMQGASLKEDYELAAIYRDQLLALDRLKFQQSVTHFTLQEADVVNFSESEGQVTFSLVCIRDHQIQAHYSFVWNNPLASPAEELQAFLLQYYERHPLPQELILPVTLPDQASCHTHWGTTLRIIVAQRGEKKKLLTLCERNAEHASHQSRSASAENELILAQIQKALALPTLPHRMECIDISNLGDTAIVASCVCFVAGKPEKNLYRLYNLKTVRTQDDFASIYEVVTRRLLAMPVEGTPDLLVIDGGKGQLAAAWQARADVGCLEIPIVSLAKSRLKKEKTASNTLAYSEERLCLAPEGTLLTLEKASPMYRMFTHLRDEAHRFALSHHRKRRSKLGRS